MCCLTSWWRQWDTSCWHHHSDINTTDTWSDVMLMSAWWVRHCKTTCSLGLLSKPAGFVGQLDSNITGLATWFFILLKTAFLTAISYRSSGGPFVRWLASVIQVRFWTISIKIINNQLKYTRALMDFSGFSLL